MNLDQAHGVLMPFGKYKGKTLGEIADEDVLYLDWLVGVQVWGKAGEAVKLLCEAYAAEIHDAMSRRHDL